MKQYLTGTRERNAKERNKGENTNTNTPGPDGRTLKKQEKQKRTDNGPKTDHLEGKDGSAYLTTQGPNPDLTGARNI